MLAGSPTHPISAKLRLNFGTPEIKLYDGLERGGGVVLERVGRARADMSNSGNPGVSGGRKD